MHQPPITQWEVVKDRSKEKYLPSFHKPHLVDQMVHFRQSTYSVSNYINSFEELTPSCNLPEDPSITIACCIRGLRIDLKREVPCSLLILLMRLTIKFYRLKNLTSFTLRDVLPPLDLCAQSAPDMSELPVSASAFKGFSFQALPTATLLVILGIMSNILVVVGGVTMLLRVPIIPLS